MHKQVNILPFANEQMSRAMSSVLAQPIAVNIGIKDCLALLSSSTPEAWEIKQEVHTFYPKTTLDIGGVFLCVLFLHLVKA